MRATQPVLPSDGWNHATQTIRVRGTVFLWGSAGVTKNLSFQKPPTLHVCNDVHGEAITFGTRTASGKKTNLGTLKPGEWISIQLQNISGVFATCKLESDVRCLIES